MVMKRMAKNYPTLKQMKDGLKITHAQARELQSMMKAGYFEPRSIMIEASKMMAIDYAGFEFSPLSRIQYDNGLDCVDALVLEVPGKEDGVTLIYDTLGSGCWHVDTEQGYRDMEHSLACYNA